MMNSRRKIQKAKSGLTKIDNGLKNEDNVNGEDQMDAETPVQNPTRTIKSVKKKKKTIAPSFDMEVSKWISLGKDEPEIVFTKKLARPQQIESTSTQTQRSQSSAYSLESLNALKKSQIELNKKAAERKDLGTTEESPAVQQAIIPDEAAVLAAKKLREKRRETETNSKDDFIAIKPTSTAVSTNVRESRLVTEDQDDSDEDEAFEDHKGKSIVFGARAIREAKDLALQEKYGLVNAYDQIGFTFSADDVKMDDEARNWELQQIKKGKRTPMDLSLSKPETQKSYKAPVRSIIVFVNCSTGVSPSLIYHRYIIKLECCSSESAIYDKSTKLTSGIITEWYRAFKWGRCENEIRSGLCFG